MYTEKGRKGANKRGSNSPVCLREKDFQELKEIYARLREKYSSDEIFSNLEEKEILVPLEIFNSKLTILQSIVKYAHENLGLKFSEISELLNRNSRIIWKSYQDSKSYSKRFVIENYSSNVSASIFSNRKLSVMENLVVYLKGKGMRYSEISKLISRDERTVWTVYNRAMKKNE